MNKKPVALSFIFYAIYTLSACVSSNSPPDENAVYTLQDEFTTFDNSVWQKSDGWSNGAPFLNGWCASNITHDTTGMQLKLENASCSGENYASGEYRSIEFYSFGRVEVQMKPVKASGVVSSLFFYTGPSDGNEHEEIDIEFLGNDTTKMQINFWAVENNQEQEHPTLIDLGFDASEAFHSYAIEWRADSIKWYVDNTLVAEKTASAGKLPSLDMKIMMNLWACSADTWCGSFNENVLPVQAMYRSFRYTEY